MNEDRLSRAHPVLMGNNEERERGGVFASALVCVSARKVSSICYRNKWAMSLSCSYLLGRKSMSYQHMCMPICVCANSPSLTDCPPTDFLNKKYCQSQGSDLRAFLSIHMHLTCLSMSVCVAVCRSGRLVGRRPSLFCSLALCPRSPPQPATVESIYKHHSQLLEL